MLQVNIHAEGQFSLDEVSAPDVGERDVVVDVAVCGICGSDLGYVAMGGLTPPGIPMPLGHELSGVVSQVGDAVAGIAVGQRVVVNPMAADNAIGNGGPEGGFAPHLLVRNAVAGEGIYTLPDHLSFEHGALVEPLSVAAHGINQAGVTADSRVVVLGAGPIGLGVVAVLKYRGVKDIAVVDLSEQRLERARQLGATHALVADRPLVELVGPHHGNAGEVFGMPTLATDVFLEATGVRGVVEDVLNSIRPGGTLVVLGVHKEPVPLDLVNLLYREITIRGAMAYPTEFPEVIEMLASGAVDLTPMVSHRYPLESFSEAFATASDASQAAKVLVEISP